MRTSATMITSDTNTTLASAPQNIPDLNLLVEAAKRKLTNVAVIISLRDSVTKAQAESHIFNGKVFGRIYISTTGEPFDKEIEKQLIISNIELQGGFTNITVSLRDCGRRMLVRAVYDGQTGNGLRHGEHTITDLLKFIKDHRREFPHGLLTKVSLVDYEGNTFHRKFSATEDGRRLHLSFEMNELDEG